jgi:4a-hydroxytetrahydrobiopterin dehydratase
MLSLKRIYVPGPVYYLMELHQKKCIPCEGIGSPMPSEKACEMIKKVDGWMIKGEKITKEFKFKDFAEAMKFINKIAETAESEGHHPDFKIHDWNCVTVDTWTHALGGLTENDFILASKINHIKV